MCTSELSRLRGQLCGLSVALLVPFLWAQSAQAEVIYDSIPTPFTSSGNPPPVAAGLSSLPFAATQTAQLGDYIQFAPGGRALTDAVVTLVTQAKHSAFPTLDPASWSIPLTLNLYGVGHSGADPTLGALIYTTTQSAAVPWVPDGRGNSSNVLGGLAFTFNFTLPDVLVPDELIFGISFSTQNYGSSPTGNAGPYDSLALGLHSATAGPSITIGTDVEPDAVFWNTNHGGYYADGGAGGVGVFRRATMWSPYSPAVEFVALDADLTSPPPPGSPPVLDPTGDPNPEPASLTLFGLGLAGLIGLRRRRNADK